jgi:hypothetical protein
MGSLETKSCNKMLSGAKILFLRGAVPTDRSPCQIMFDDVDKCDDMWTQLCRAVINEINGYGEIWYTGGERVVEYTPNFIERWLPDFQKKYNDFNPDVIFARGGFSYYDNVLCRYPNAFKIYYGAGFRRTPSSQFNNFNLVFVDTPEQLSKAQKKLPHCSVQLLIKPAADNIFKPVVGIEKIYDIILVGNYNKGVDKGHDFAFSHIPPQFKILSIGKIPISIMKKYKNITYKGWIPRKEIPLYYAQSKAAIICCGTEDSCPRVIPEALACNCPILVLKRVNFWKSKYINIHTGIITSEKELIPNLILIINLYQQFKPYDFYKNNLSLQISAKEILKYIEEISQYAL